MSSSFAVRIKSWDVSIMLALTGPYSISKSSQSDNSIKDQFDAPMRDSQYFFVSFLTWFSEIFAACIRSYVQVIENLDPCRSDYFFNNYHITQEYSFGNRRRSLELCWYVNDISNKILVYLYKRHIGTLHIFLICFNICSNQMSKYLLKSQHVYQFISCNGIMM